MGMPGLMTAVSNDHLHLQIWPDFNPPAIKSFEMSLGVVVGRETQWGALSDYKISHIWQKS